MEGARDVNIQTLCQMLVEQLVYWDVPTALQKDHLMANFVPSVQLDRYKILWIKTGASTLPYAKAFNNLNYQEIQWAAEDANIVNTQNSGQTILSQGVN